jgi:16S rRNA (guanine1516-N2)-methyltransferase
LSDGRNETSFRMTKAVCTTPWKDTFTATKRAMEVADFFHIPFVSRKDRSIGRIFADESCEAIVVMNRAPAVYHITASETPLFFHPNMAAQRILRIRRGEPDRLISCARIEAGDTVVDATLGLGADSLVLSAAVGENGQVISLESEDVLFQLFRFAKEHGNEKYPDIVPYLSRIHVILANHNEWLKRQKPNSVDVVYFDPMFQSPQTNSAGLLPIRPFADRAPLSESAFFHATRIARKCVVVKEHTHAKVFRQFHLQANKTYSSISYGVWNKE